MSKRRWFAGVCFGIAVSLMSKIALEAIAGLGPNYYTSLAWQYENAREPARAREFYRKALDRNPDDDYARSALERLADEEG